MPAPKPPADLVPCIDDHVHARHRAGPATDLPLPQVQGQAVRHV